MQSPLTKDLTDDFWNDCFNNQEAKTVSQLLPYRQYCYGRNNNKKNFRIKQKNNQASMNISSHKHNKKNNSNKTQNRTMDNPNLAKIYKNHTVLQEHIETNKVDKELELKRKNAQLRCLGLYAYGVEVKKAKILNDENTKKEKLKSEMSKCTFKPKISKYSKNKQTKFSPDFYYNKNKKQNNKINTINSNGDYKLTTISNTNTIENGVTKKINKTKNNKNTINTINNEEDSDNFEECTFKPKINKKNIKKVFGKSKSLANEKDNAEFFLRYNKAREEYMIKKLKKLSTKDDSYETTLMILTNKMNNKHYKNNSKDNNYDGKMQKNNNKRNMMDNMDSSFYSKQLNIEKNIINNLRNDLLTIDLNDEEE